MSLPQAELEMNVYLNDVKMFFHDSQWAIDFLDLISNL